MGAFEDLDPNVSTIGQAPIDDTGKAVGPFGHITTHAPGAGIDDFGGAQLGFGGLMGSVAPGMFMEILSGNLGLGEFIDPQGKDTFGVGGDLTMGKASVDPGAMIPGLGFDFDVFDAQGGAALNEDTLSIGGGANLIGGGITVGNQERSMRVGGSLGAGASGRIHHGDADGDGLHEFGFGFDAGPLSFDMKSEDILGDAGMLLAATQLPMVSQMGMGMQAASSTLNPIFNSLEASLFEGLF